MTEDKKRAMCLEELAVVSAALSNFPKSYSAWQHRCWLVGLGLCNMQEEFRFVEKNLAEDSRNFHAWNYRRFLVQKSERAPQIELGFSQEMIEQNFSNYSAWHHRSRCLEALHRPIATISLTDLIKQEEGATEDVPQKGWVSLETLKIEFQTVHSAFVTDPDDSSAWIYYRWLLSHFLHLEKSEETAEVLKDEVTFFEQELMEIDPESKWILLTYAVLLELRNRRDGHTSSQQIKKIYRKLCDVDPMRRGFYQDVENDRASILMEII